jgi:hypothetical protein
MQIGMNLLIRRSTMGRQERKTVARETPRDKHTAMADQQVKRPREHLPEGNLHPEISSQKLLLTVSNDPRQ